MFVRHTREKIPRVCTRTGKQSSLRTVFDVLRKLISSVNWNSQLVQTRANVRSSLSDGRLAKSLGQTGSLSARRIVSLFPFPLAGFLSLMNYRSRTEVSMSDDLYLTISGCTPTLILEDSVIRSPSDEETIEEDLYIL